MPKIVKLLISLGITFFAGAVGSFFTFPAISTWYATLNKPTFSPPNFLFGPVWTILYILMGVALFLVWSDNSKKKKLDAMLSYGFQIALNALWSIVFFGLKNPLLAVAVIIALWVMILLTIINFYKINKTAGLMLVPYILWVSFASLLNIFVAILN